MSQGRAAAIAQALDQLAAALETLEQAGAGVPAVEKNVVRMRGALHVLRVQFSDLAEAGHDP